MRRISRVLLVLGVIVMVVVTIVGGRRIPRRPNSPSADSASADFGVGRRVRDGRRRILGRVGDGRLRFVRRNPHHGRFRSGQGFVLLHLGGISVRQIGSSRCDGRGLVRGNRISGKTSRACQPGTAWVSGRETQKSRACGVNAPATPPSAASRGQHAISFDNRRPRHFFGVSLTKRVFSRTGCD